MFRCTFVSTICLLSRSVSVFHRQASWDQIGFYSYLCTCWKMFINDRNKATLMNHLSNGVVVLSKIMKYTMIVITVNRIGYFLLISLLKVNFMPSTVLKLVSMPFIVRIFLVRLIVIIKWRNSEVCHLLFRFACATRIELWFAYIPELKSINSFITLSKELLSTWFQ